MISLDRYLGIILSGYTIERERSYLVGVGQAGQTVEKLTLEAYYAVATNM